MLDENTRGRSEAQAVAFMIDRLTRGSAESCFDTEDMTAFGPIADLTSRGENRLTADM